MDTRPDFPDTITFARDYVYSIQALGEKIDPNAKEKIRDFTRKIQRPDRGFSIDPTGKETNSIYIK